MTAAFKSLADDSATGIKSHPTYTYTGKVESVNASEHTLALKGILFTKTFNLGNSCTYSFVDPDASTVNGLRPGQKVRVVYEESQGVRVADRVVQEPMRDTGVVKTLDPAQRTLTLRHDGLDQSFQLAGDCKVMLRDNKPGGAGDIQPGNYVTVTYETPKGKPMAREIAQTSETFTGSLTAIDLEAKTIKARALFDTKKFNVGDNCAILVNGNNSGQLSDLRPNERLVFSYDDINGVNVVNRIAPAATPQPTETTAAQPMAR